MGKNADVTCCILGQELEVELLEIDSYFFYPPYSPGLASYYFFYRNLKFQRNILVQSYSRNVTTNLKHVLE